MALKLFGLVITTSSALKAAEAAGLSLIDRAVQGLAADDTVKKEVQDIISAVEQPGASGMEKLENAARETLDLLSKYGFAGTIGIAKKLVQSVFDEGKAEVTAAATSILAKLGLRG